MGGTRNPSMLWGKIKFSPMIQSQGVPIKEKINTAPSIWPHNPKPKGPHGGETSPQPRNPKPRGPQSTVEN